MSSTDSRNDRSPLFVLGSIPVYAVTLIVGVIALSMVAFSLMMAAGTSPAFLIFDTAAVLRGQVWRIVTHPLCNFPSFFMAINLFFFFWFGREIETYLGRRAFFRLYTLLLLAPVLVLLAIPRATLAGADHANFAVFIAFAVLYPRAQIFFGIEARWLALVYLAISILQALAIHAWMSVLPLLISSTAAFAFIRHEQGRWSFKLPQRQPNLRVIEGGTPKANAPTNVDVILEKISRSGMDSLTLDERDQLEKARQHLLRK